MYAVFRRRLLENGQLTLDAEYRYAADKDLLLRLASGGAIIRHIPQYLSVFGIDGTNLSSHAQMSHEAEKIRLAHGAFRSDVLRNALLLGRRFERLLRGAYRPPGIAYSYATDELPTYKEFYAGNRTGRYSLSDNRGRAASPLKSSHLTMETSTQVIGLTNPKQSRAVSFTGVPVFCAIGVGLLFALSRPLIGISLANSSLKHIPLALFVLALTFHLIGRSVSSGRKVRGVWSGIWQDLWPLLTLGAYATTGSLYARFALAEQETFLNLGVYLLTMPLFFTLGERTAQRSNNRETACSIVGRRRLVGNPG